MEITSLDPKADWNAVADLFRRAADYVRLESGVAPDAGTVSSFFEDVVPNGRLDAAVKVGLWDDGVLLGLGDMGFGYPEARDAYIGLMIFDPAARGQGFGRHLLGYLEGVARDHGAVRLLVAVLDANPKARAFWEREGFTLERSFPPSGDGAAAHLRHRLTKTL